MYNENELKTGSVQDWVLADFRAVDLRLDCSAEDAV